MKPDTPHSRRGVPKGDKRERTRHALLKAASATIREKGYEGTTLDDVAGRAGMSRGAIYGNFKNRDDLFMAVAQDQWRPLLSEVALRETLTAYLRAIGEAVAEAALARRRGGVHAAAYRVYLHTHEEMRERVAAQDQATQRALGEHLLDAFGAEALPMPPEQFARLIHVLAAGLLFAHFDAPEHVTPDFIIASFEALGR
ncbi:TetR family transcriptional regulator [Phenylobacterium sp.]|uniref:TetR/AcrR family transcriptional regulator n=1 Tax=Phenylobacterium sp. TaxID=1871053 RepID=UPI0030F4B3B3